MVCYILFVHGNRWNVTYDSNTATNPPFHRVQFPPDGVPMTLHPTDVCPLQPWHRGWIRKERVQTSWITRWSSPYCRWVMQMAEHSFGQCEKPSKQYKNTQEEGPFRNGCSGVAGNGKKPPPYPSSSHFYPSIVPSTQLVGTSWTNTTYPNMCYNCASAAHTHTRIRLQPHLWSAHITMCHVCVCGVQ